MLRWVMLSLARAVRSQLHPRMLLLTLAPFLLSLLVWGLGLWIGLQPAVDWLQAWLSSQGWFQSVGATGSWLGLGALNVVIVPLIAMWLLLPMMIVTALLFVTVLAMPAIVRHVSSRHYPQLARHGEGSFFGSIGTTLRAFVGFAAVWLLTLPLVLIPPFTLIIQPLLWAWLTTRVMAYDALADHATAAERHALVQRHRIPLLAIGIATGALSAIPALLWLGGVLSVVLFPLVAALSIWLYVMAFMLTALWFEHYCLHALAAYRQAVIVPSTLPSGTPMDMRTP